MQSNAEFLPREARNIVCLSSVWELFLLCSKKIPEDDGQINQRLWSMELLFLSLDSVWTTRFIARADFPAIFPCPMVLNAATSLKTAVNSTKELDLWIACELSDF